MTRSIRFMPSMAMVILLLLVRSWSFLSAVNAPTAKSCMSSRRRRPIPRWIGNLLLTCTQPLTRRHSFSWPFAIITVRQETWHLLSPHREAIEKAWAFESGVAQDSDGDGIYDNSQGTGWVEGWPHGMPHQEVYLALLDEQASQAYAALASALQNSQKAADAATRATAIHNKIESEYYDEQRGCYAFSHNIDWRRQWNRR